MKGIINILKPPGMTSFDIIYFCRKVFEMKKIGHAGTLDPGAAGVLAVCLGRGTKVVPFLTDTRKAYRAEITLGVETTTLDAFGEITKKAGEFFVSQEEVERVLKEFIGEIEQIPPMYSAIKHNGKRLYKLARQGKKVKRKPRTIDIYNIDLVSFEGKKLIIDVECSKGTYIRTLCADIGKRLGIGAYMSFLVRTKVGEYSLSEALTLEEIELLKKKDRIEELVQSLDSALTHLRSIRVSEDTNKILRNGAYISLNQLADDLIQPPKAGEKFRVYDFDNNFIAVYAWHTSDDKNIFKPERVFV
ncbi:tRNA pseudouridine(55) synthase TruB [Orenia marismortui]|uniref:tRNA pseudouridine synthase B n=1 Tax=Orenia marismortui TaxID=46469 RepID=A0A4R8H1B6_9FIRM|nr:tRNA pseudouridine(55) synthase TruB [Orenia marismortui]TDX51879.1 tRNA pseudouridine synthase B [Orenia marismortui]